MVQFPKSYLGNKYAVVFMDYLTKWPEVFPTKDQSALTIAHLLVEQIVSRHGVPSEVLSDRGTSFLSKLMQELYDLLGTHKISTTAYHPQTDGLVEKFHRTLSDMLAKTVEEGGRDWDTRLPYVLFAYRTSMQESTKESPFFLLYGRDAQLPTEAALSPPEDSEFVDLDDYRAEVAQKLSHAWEMARSNVTRAQKQQKKYYDRRARPSNFCVGDRVFVYMPTAKSTKAHKFARPFYGPYRILQVFETGAEVRPVDRPQSKSIRVAFNRLRSCPREVGDQFWPTSGDKLSTKKKNPPTAAEPNVWSGRLRPVRGRSVPKSGDV